MSASRDGLRLKIAVRKQQEPYHHHHHHHHHHLREYGQPCVALDLKSMYTGYMRKIE